MTRESFRLDYTFFSLLLFVMYAALTSFWAVCDINVSSMVFTLLQLFGFYMIVRLNLTDEKDFRSILWAIYIGALAMCVYTLFFYGPGEIFSRILVGKRIGQEINQVNGMGLYCTVLNVMTLYFVMYEKIYWCLAVLPLSVFIMLGAGSRKSFLLMALALLLLFMFRSKKGVVVRFLAVAAILLVGLYFILEFADRESNYFLFRIAQVFEIFQDDQAGLRDVSLSTRSDMMKYGMELFSDNPIFGYGPEQYEYFYSVLHGVRRPPHSTFIQILVGYGIIGFSLFYGIYVYVIAKLVGFIRKRRKYSILILTFAMVFLANDFGANMLNNKYMYLFFGIYAAYIKMKLDEEKGDMVNEDHDSGPALPHKPNTNMPRLKG